MQLRVVGRLWSRVWNWCLCNRSPGMGVGYWTLTGDYYNCVWPALISHQIGTEIHLDTPRPINEHVVKTCHHNPGYCPCLLVSNEQVFYFAVDHCCITISNTLLASTNKLSVSLMSWSFNCTHSEINDRSVTPGR